MDNTVSPGAPTQADTAHTMAQRQRPSACFGAGDNQDNTVSPGAPTQAGTAVAPAPPPPQGFFARLGSEIKQDFESAAVHVLPLGLQTLPGCAARPCHSSCLKDAMCFCERTPPPTCTSCLDGSC